MSESTPAELPCAGLRVVEFTRRGMGLARGMVLDDLGAPLIEVEPVGQGRRGDRARCLPGRCTGCDDKLRRLGPSTKEHGMDLSFSLGGIIPLWILSAPLLAAAFSLGTTPKHSRSESRSTYGGRGAQAVHRPVDQPVHPSVHQSVHQPVHQPVPLAGLSPQRL